MNCAIRLIVGLGNPGPQYQDTRHNAGAWLVEALAEQHQISLRAENKFLGDYAKFRHEQQDRHLLNPTTFMNRSGASVAAVCKFYKINPSEILVVHDELDLPPGLAKLKQGGGHAGHNGLRDIIAALGSNEFLRLRLGIGHPGSPDKVSNFVLSPPSKTEKQLLIQGIDHSLAALPTLLNGDLAKAMQQLHTQQEGK